MRLPRVLEELEEPTVRDRPIGLLVIAAASVIAGIAIVASAMELFAGGVAYRDWTQPKLVGNDLTGMVQVYPEHYLLVGVILLIPALYLFGLAAGIVRQRPWAWILAFVAGGLFAIYGVLALVIPGDAAANADRWHLAASLPWIVLGLAILRYLGRTLVKADLGWGDPSIG